MPTDENMAPEAELYLDIDHYLATEQPPNFSLFSSWDWAKRHGIPDPFEHPVASTGTVWRPGDPNIWGYWPSDAFRALECRWFALEAPCPAGTIECSRCEFIKTL